VIGTNQNFKNLLLNSRYDINRQQRGEGKILHFGAILSILHLFQNLTILC